MHDHCEGLFLISVNRFQNRKYSLDSMSPMSRNKVREELPMIKKDGFIVHVDNNIFFYKIS